MMPERIYAEQDPETNAKRWYSTKGMGDEYVRVDIVAQLERENGNLRAAFRANMLRYGPRENLDAEIDRVLNECSETNT